MTESDDLVNQFRATLREAFGFEPSVETISQFRWALSRVSRQNEHDLASAVVLACFEDRAEAGAPLRDDDVRRAVWRVVKGATRQAARAANIDPSRVHVPRPVPPAEEVVSKDEELEKIQRAIAEMSMPDQAVVLRVLDGATTAEIAAELDLTQQAVRKRLQRIRENLRETLRPG